MSEPTKTPCDTIINAGWVLPIAPQNIPLREASIAIGTETILAIGSHDEIEAAYVAQSTVELPDHIVLPGLVNAHGHAAMSLFRGLTENLPLQAWLTDAIWPLESRLVTPEFVREGTRLALAEMIKAGITCFSDMYFFPEVVAEEARLAGLRTQITFPVIEFANAWSTGAEDAVHKGLALHDTYRNDGLVHVAFGPHSTYSVSEAGLTKVLMYAEELDLNIQIHLHENAQEVADAHKRVGKSWLVFLSELGMLSPRLQAVHATQLAPEEITLLAEAGVQVIHCPHSNLKLASGICPTNQLQAAGVNVALGTDGAASNNSLDVLGEARLASLLAKHLEADAAVLPETKALEMATLGGARALGLGNKIGSLEPGKLADLIAVDVSEPRFQPLYDPIAQLIHTDAGSAVTHAWVAGRSVLIDGMLATLDEASVVAAAKHWQVRINRICEPQA
ncbi:MAG: TRZ/ATZ family hydrolase [Gammaproteobacteria bacterium]|nr:TRZ/ATZ family hydrolase [Gammaproteobacteria bacterium]